MYTLIYRFGNIHNPANPQGEVSLEIKGNPKDLVANISYSQKSISDTKSVRYNVRPATIQSLWTALRKSPFPKTSSKPIAPDTTMRELSVQSPELAEGTEQFAVIPWHLDDETQGYTELFAMLDSIITQISDDHAEKGEL